MNNKFLAATALLAATAAQAHPGHGVESFTTGLAHPFQGLDHLLAMAVVGLWSAAALPSSRRLAGPAVFLVLLLAGAVAGHAGIAVPGVEIAVALSVMVLGALMLLARRLSPGTGLAMIGAAALLHGMAHGAELTPGHAFAGYAAGFMLGSALLHGMGLAAGSWLQARRTWLWSGTAALVAVSGALMFATRV